MLPLLSVSRAIFSHRVSNPSIANTDRVGLATLYKTSARSLSYDRLMLFLGDLDLPDQMG